MLNGRFSILEVVYLHSTTVAPAKMLILARQPLRSAQGKSRFLITLPRLDTVHILLRLIVCRFVCFACPDTSTCLNLVFMSSEAISEPRTLEVYSRVGSWRKSCDVCYIPRERLTEWSGPERDLNDLYRSAVDGCLTCKIIKDAFEKLLSQSTFSRTKRDATYILNVNDDLRIMVVYLFVLPSPSQPWHNPDSGDFYFDAPGELFQCFRFVDSLISFSVHFRSLLVFLASRMSILMLNRTETPLHTIEICAAIAHPRCTKPQAFEDSGMGT